MYKGYRNLNKYNFFTNPILLQKYVDNTRIITHLTKIMLKNEITGPYLLHIRAAEVYEL